MHRQLDLISIERGNRIKRYELSRFFFSSGLVCVCVCLSLRSCQSQLIKCCTIEEAHGEKKKEPWMNKKKRNKIGSRGWSLNYSIEIAHGWKPYETLKNQSKQHEKITICFEFVCVCYIHIISCINNRSSMGRWEDTGQQNERRTIQNMTKCNWNE